MSDTGPTKGTIDDYRILPVHGGGVCAVGTLRGVGPWRTTNLVRATRGMVETASGSRYALGAPHVSMWAMQLQIARPEKYAALQAFDIV